MSYFASKKCRPCEGNTAPFTSDAIKRYLAELNPAWKHVRKNNTDQIEREFKCKDFVAAMKFVNAAARVAEEEQHHPDINIHYNKIRIVLWTHAINGLSENDFILAAKIDLL